MKIALAQINPTVGDLEGNAAKIGEFVARARGQADLVVFPELALTGYPPKDLLYDPDFMARTAALADRLAPAADGIGVLLGLPFHEGDYLYNGAALLEDGRVVFRQAKTLLPNYDVFEERRYFKPAGTRRCFKFRGLRLGITICEDIWNDKDFWRRPVYDVDPIEELAPQQPDLFVNLSASPYHFGKHALRLDLVSRMTHRYGVPVVYVNQVGGNDELIFDGASFYMDRQGQGVQLAGFREELAVVDVTQPGADSLDAGEDIGWVHAALVLGIRDFLHKTGFRRAVIGLSGGIDSAIVAALAAEALGPENVLGVALPSRYSSAGSVADARELAENLGIEYRLLSIEEPFQAFINTLAGGGGLSADTAEENIQSRIRGAMLMFISNREGRMLLTTGNKSELGVGYATLYGDMCGGLAVISDLPKTMVYRLAEDLNRRAGRDLIPRSTLTKAPSAELKPDQTDQDTLPPYEVLDEILQSYVEDQKSLAEIAALGYDPGLVQQVVAMVDRAEFKRRQAPPGLKVTTKSFGYGRRFPIAQGWRRSNSAAPPNPGPEEVGL